MLYRKQILLLFYTFLTIYTATAQETHDHEHHHEHHKHEVSVGAFPAFFVNENELTYGMHLHYTYNFPSTKVGIGVGYEKIFDEHKHNSISIFLNYRPIENLHIGLGPGLAFEGAEIKEAVYATHFETFYEFIIKGFHLGPVLGMGVDKNDFHISMGIHFGIGF